MKLGPISMQKGDEFFVNFIGLANNCEQWPNPHEFIPERFDTSSQHFLTKDG